MGYSLNTISARTRALIERDGFDGVLEFYQNRDDSITEQDILSWASGESIPQDSNIARSIARRGLSLTGQAVVIRDVNGRFTNRVTFTRLAFREAYDRRLNEGQERREQNQSDLDAGRITQEDFDEEDFTIENEFDEGNLAEQYTSLDEWYYDLNSGFRIDWIDWEIAMGYRTADGNYA